MEPMSKETVTKGAQINMKPVHGKNVFVEFIEME